MANRRDTSGRRPRRSRTRTDGRGTSQARQRPLDDLADAGDAGPSPQEALVRGLQQVWLAGLGAIARAPKEGPAAFGDAVVEGLRLLDTSRSAAQRLMRERLGDAQGTLQSRVAGARMQALETWDSLESLFQNRVQRAMQQLGVPSAEAIRELTESVAELHASVQNMSSPPPSRRRKASAKKKSTRTARKPGARGREDAGT